MADKQQSTEIRDRIFSEAVSLFARKGYAATGVREIGKAANVTASAIGYHFENKAGLLIAMINTFFEKYLASAKDTFKGDDPTPDKIRRFIIAICKMFHENQELIRVVLKEFPDDVPEVAAAKAQNILKLIATIRPQFSADMSLEEIDPRIRTIIGPGLASLMSSHYLLKPAIERFAFSDLNDDFYAMYPEAIADFFIAGASAIIQKAAEGGYDNLTAD